MTSTGPFTSEDVEYGPSINGGPHKVWRYKLKEWYRGKKPYHTPLRYLMQDFRLVSGSANFAGVSFEWSQALCNDTKVNSLTDRMLSAASVSSYNKAYGRTLESIDDAKSQLLAAAAEGAQALDMIGRRAEQLRAAIQWARGRGGPVGGISTPKPKKRRKPKIIEQEMANLWLEYSFGWAPLVGDVHNAVKTFCKGLPTFRISGKGTSQNYFHEVSGDLTIGKTTRSMDLVSRHRILGRVGITNINVWRANQLGLLNPAYALWEVTPWSFVFDYFVNVGEWLNGFTDVSGLEQHDICWTWKCEVKSNQTLEWTSGSKYYTATWSGKRFEFHRDVGSLVGPFLHIRDPWRLSAQRASTSVALLLQQMRH